MKPILTAKNICKSFGNKKDLKNISLKVNEGEIVGIIGKNGSGKTVLLKIWTDLYLPNSGEVNYINITQHEIGALIDIGFLPNKTGLNNLKIISSICKTKITSEDCYNLLLKVGLNPFDKTLYKNYSTGMKQRLALAYVLLEKPKFLILDEPFNGIDKESVEDFRRLLLNLKKDNKAILITSHDQEDIYLLCDKVYKMDDGEILELL